MNYDSIALGGIIFSDGINVLWHSIGGIRIVNTLIEVAFIR